MANALNKDPFTYAEDRRKFLEDLKSFHASRGTPFERIPKIEGTDIDLYRLYRRVVDLGGWKKVNHLMLWDDIQEEFKIPAACSNGAQALKFAYIRFLNIYEKVKFWGLCPDDGLIDGTDGPSRKKICLPLETIPMSYNYSQHKVADAEREANKLSTDLARVKDFDKLEMALRSGLTNEVDFAFSVCLLLSDGDRLKLNKTSHLVSLLLACVGIFEDGHASMEDVMTDSWDKGESKRDYIGFWLDIVKDEQTRESIKSKKGICNKDDRVGGEVLHLGRELGRKNVEGLRVTQLAVLMRNLSYDDVNCKPLASNHLVLRFLMLCAYSSFGTLPQLALDTLGNLASQMVLQPVENASSQPVMKLIQKSLEEEDKFVILRALEMLNKLCQLDANEPVLNKSLEGGTYCRIVHLLMVHDMQIIIHSLEALHQLSGVGETTATMIASVRSAVDILVNMITVDAQSFGPDAQQDIRVVEYIPDDVTEKAQGQSSPQPSSYIIEVVAPHHRTSERPAEAEVQPPLVEKAPPEVETTASNWVTSTYEVKADSRMSQAELYSEYQQMGRKFEMSQLLSFSDLVTVVKLALPQVCVAEVDKGGGEKEAVFQGLCRRPQAKPFAILTGSGTTCTVPPLVAVAVTQTSKTQPVLAPKPQPACTQKSQKSVSCVAASCQVGPSALPTPTSQKLGSGSSQTSRLISVSSQQALKAKVLNHQHTSTAPQPQQVAGSSSRPSAFSQQTVHRRIAPSSASVQTLPSLPVRCDTSTTSSTVVPVSTAVTVSSATATSCTWITIPCSGQPLQQNPPAAGKDGGKLVSRGNQTVDNSVVKTLLAQKVCQQMGSQGNVTSQPSHAAHKSFSDASTSPVCVATPQHRQLQPKLQQQLQHRVLAHNQSSVQVQQHQQQHQQQSHLPTGQVSVTCQPATGQSLPQATHTQQAPGIGMGQQNLLLHNPQVRGDQRATPIPAQQANAVAVQPHLAQPQQTLQPSPQQSTAIQRLLQAAQASAQPHQQESLHHHQQPVAIQKSLQETQASIASPAVQQSSSLLLRQLMTAQNQTGTTLLPAPSPMMTPGGQVLLQQQQQPGGQTPGQTAHPLPQGSTSQAMSLPQPSSSGVQNQLQGQQQSVQLGQPQVMQMQPRVQQLVQVPGQQLVLYQHLPQQQIRIQPRGQIVLHHSGQPVQLQPQQQIIMQQRQPQLIIQGPSGLQQILQQPVQKLQIQNPSQGQGQPMKIQQPLVLQLPMYQWPQTGASQMVTVCSNSQPTTVQSGSVGDTAQGATVPYRTIVPRPASVASPSHSSQQADLTLGLHTGQHVDSSKQNLGTVKHVPVQCSSQTQRVQQNVTVQTEQAVGAFLPSTVSVCQPAKAGAVPALAAQPVRDMSLTARVPPVPLTTIQSCATSSQAISESSSSVSISLPRASPCSMNVSWSSSSSVPLISQHLATGQSSSTVFVPSKQNVSVPSNDGVPHTSQQPHTQSAKYNGHMNGARFHIPNSKEVVCNGENEDCAADTQSLVEEKVNGVLGSPSSDSCDVPSPLMSLKVKKEYVNGCVERCVPHLPDSLTGCSKEWLQNLAQKTSQVKDVFSFDEDSHLTKDLMDVDDVPRLRDKMGTPQNGVDPNQKCSAWQRNGLIAHAGTKEVPTSFSHHDHHPTLVKRNSLDEASLDSIDSKFMMNKSSRANDFGSRPLVSPDSSYDGDRSCDSRASSLADFIGNEKEGGLFFPSLPALPSAPLSPSPPSSLSSCSDVPSSKTVSKGTKRKPAATPKEKPPAKSKKQKTSKEKVSVETSTVSVATTPMVMEYMCKWEGCRRCFTSAQLVLSHATKTHVPSGPESFCRWQGCQPLRRKRWSLVTHLQDHHCSEAVQRGACQRRFLTAHRAVFPQSVQPPPMVYPEDAAVQAILRFQSKPPFAEFSDEREGPLTKHIRLTSALTLRNIARYSSLGRRLIQRREQELSCAAMSAAESSSALASCLWELFHDS